MVIECAGVVALAGFGIAGIDFRLTLSIALPIGSMLGSSLLGRRHLFWPMAD